MLLYQVQQPFFVELSVLCACCIHYVALRTAINLLKGLLSPFWSTSNVCVSATIEYVYTEPGQSRPWKTNYIPQHTQFTPQHTQYIPQHTH